MQIRLDKLLLLSLMLAACNAEEAATDSPLTTDSPPTAEAQPPAPEQSVAPVPAPEPPPVVDVSVEGNASACNLPQRFSHATHEGSETVLYDSGILAYRTPYRVNTDGAPNSYHPDDPGGSRGFAINTICNGANAITASGEKVNYRECQRLIDLFREAKEADWPASGARMEFYGVAASTENSSQPCIEDEGQYAGYFVSSTSVQNNSYELCEQQRYLDALSVPFIIVPGHSNFQSRGMGVRDLAVVYNPANERMLFAMVGDQGPARGLGEGSVALNRTLSGRADWPKTRRETYNFGLRDAVTVVFTDASMEAPFTPERIAEAGQVALARFGGAERVTACAEALQ